MSVRTHLTPEALVCTIVGDAATDFLSAQLWPLDLALAKLDQTAPDGSLRRTLGRMPHAAGRGGLRFSGLRGTLHALVRRGLLVPGGSGWEAGYSVAPELARDGQQLAATLTPAERAAIREAAQALVAATSMASKNPAASLPSGSVTI